MEVILLSDQRHLGRRGEVVKVKPGYARNFLLPQGVALEATPSNLKYFAAQRKKIDLKHAKEREGALAIAGELAALRLTIAKKVGETQTLYGSVTAAEIAEELAKRGISVDKRRIDLGAGIKVLGDHKVTVDLHPDVLAEITVTVVAEE